MGSPSPNDDPDHDRDNRSENTSSPNRLKHIYVYYDLSDTDPEPSESFWGTEPDPMVPWVIAETAFKTWKSVALHYESAFPEVNGRHIHWIFAVDLDERERLNDLLRRRGATRNLTGDHPEPARAPMIDASYAPAIPLTEDVMGTHRIHMPAFHHQHQREAPVFTTTSLRAYARYLAARNGIDHHEFTTEDRRPDSGAARAFADEMSRQLGPFLTEIISVEQKKNRVTVVLRDGFLEEW